MQRGNLIVYDDNGRIWVQSGEAEGDVLPHEYPVGIPYMELPYGTMATKILKGIDVTKVPHQPILEEIIRVESEAERLQREKEELENQMLLMADSQVGGIL